MAGSSGLWAWLALGVALLLWSSAYAGIRAGLEGYSPGQLGVFRFAIASLVLALYAILEPFRRPERREIPRLRSLLGGGITLAGVVLVHRDRQ